MDPLLGGQLTGGSTSIRYAWDPMRKAGATARVLLINAAAQQWQVDPATCHAQAGQVDARGQQSQSSATVNWSMPPRSCRRRRMCRSRTRRTSRSSARRSSVSIRRRRWTAPPCSGSTCGCRTWSTRPLRTCPVFGGTLGSVDDTNAKTIPGVRQVVKADNAVAVIGDHTWAAKRGLAALDINWNEGAGANLSMKQIVDDLAAAADHGNGAVARKDGDVDEGLLGRQDARRRGLSATVPRARHDGAGQLHGARARRTAAISGWARRCRRALSIRP